MIVVLLTGSLGIIHRMISGNFDPAQKSNWLTILNSVPSFQVNGIVLLIKKIPIAIIIANFKLTNRIDTWNLQTKTSKQF